MKPIIAFFLIGFNLYSFAQVNTTDMEAVYPFNGNANDLSGNGNHAIVHGALLSKDRLGSLNAAYKFYGAEYIEVYSAFDFPRRTISLWFYADTITSSVGVLYNSDNANLMYGSTILLVLEIGGKKSIRFSVSGASSNLFHYEPINEKEWYNASIVVNPNWVKYYLNCNLVAQFPFTESNSNNGTATAKIGCGRLYNNFFNGTIDDIRIYSNDIDNVVLNQICSEEGISTSAEHLTKQRVRIFPNVTSGEISIEGEGIESIKIINVVGAVLKESNNLREKAVYQENISGFESGIYFVSVLINGEWATKRIVLQN